MSSKDKENPLSKFRQFFRAPRTSGGNVKERDLWPELEKELRPETPVAQRCKALKDLGDVVLNTKFEDASVTKLWELTKDLIVDNKSTEHRQTTLTFYKKLIQGQYNNLSLMREHFFIVIQKHEVPEDLRHRLELLVALTENGKDISNFEEKIGKFMLQWVPAIVEANLTEPYLEMLANIIKFNAAHLEHDIVVGIVHMACSLSCTVENTDIGLQSIKLLELVMSYAIFPNETLPLCVTTLCKTVNHVPYCQTSWKNMRILLGTDMGYAALLLMCNILNDKSFYDDEVLLRGAVFHTNMGVFGTAVQSQPQLSTKSTVLASFLHVLESQKIIVTYEVILSIQMMIPKHGKDLPEHIWDIVCDILFAVADNIRHYEEHGLAKDFVLQTNFHEAIDKIEQMLRAEDISANPDLIYDLIEKVSESRPEISVLNLIEYRSSKVTATRPEWLQVLHEFVQRFYKIPNTKIRIRTIQSLVRIMHANRAGYEEEILERVVIPEFSQIANETDLHVRTAVSQALIEFAWHCDTKRCGELLDILEKILNRPFDLYTIDGFVCQTEAEMTDVSTVVKGLIDVFVVKLHRLPSCHAIRIFGMLVGHLEMHYQRPKVFEHVPSVRNKIFTWMLQARANSHYHIGYPDPANNSAIRFSHYLGIDSSLPLHGNGHQTPISSTVGQDTIPSVNFTTISIRRACKIIVTALESDRDFCIFQLVLKELPNILQNKALIQGNDIESLANALFKILVERKSDDISSLVLPAVASLVIYHQFLSPSKQQCIIEALKGGIFSRIANVCINTLTIMILEMPETLMRKLPDVLLEMSKMSDTVNVAIPVLEFLSILSRLPNHLFANFVPRQYMYVFAMSLPYTKPHRYDHYTVSLAHHVIAGWFLKCKLALRKNFVNYIISSIQSNASMLFKDINELTRNMPRPDLNTLNEDSSNRKRSTSLTERGSRTRDNASDNMRPLLNDSLKSFHDELTETCIDFLARHTYSPCSALPKRLPAVDHLLKDGPSQTWLIGNNLVTITTNGCSSNPSKNGLCDRCSQMGKSVSDTFAKSEAIGTPNSFGAASPEINTMAQKEGLEFPAQNRRYTKASLQYSSGTESGSTDLTSSTSSSSQHPNSTDGQKSLRQTSNSSSGSLEALSRRGSNPDSVENRESSATNSTLGNSLNHLSAPSPQLSVQQQICARSCTGWAEIYVRRPTGNISWVMRIQNPIANDCLGNDMPFHDLISLFLPTQYGGVFGPDFVGESRREGGVAVPSQVAPADNKTEKEKLEQEAVQAVTKVRALKRQEEVTSSSASGPIDIPKAATRTKDRKGSFSDDEDDEDDTAFEDGEPRSRNPVRRVNSSPEMSSSWRTTFLASKQSTKEPEPTVEKEPAADVTAEQQQKKKGYAKDMRVSCEAIPEEIAGSTPPSQSESLKDEEQPKEKKEQAAEPPSSSKDTILPPKQHSADDATSQPQSTVVSISASTTSLKIPLDTQKVTSKPPQSPTPLSPRLLAKNAASKVASFSSNVSIGPNGADYGNDMIRGRSKTISVVREVNRNTRPIAPLRPITGAKSTANSKLGISPSFVFLQLFHNGQVPQAKDLPLKVGTDNLKALNLLDFIPPFETHNIGVLYVGVGQCNNEVEILKNRYGSTRYVEFLRNIGTLVSLKDAKENNLFINMETSGRDGNFTYLWKDDIVQVTFHVATLMPNKEKDPNCNEKKKNIGNDYVSIVYNESGEEYNLNTIKGQFNYACVVVQPLELNTNRVFVIARKEIAKFVCHPEPKIVSDRSAPLLARQLALHANLAAQVYQSLKTKNPIPYASNWLERLRKIKHLRAKLVKESQLSQSGDPDDATGSNLDVSRNQKQNQNLRDFTNYV